MWVTKEWLPSHLPSFSLNVSLSLPSLSFSVSISLSTSGSSHMFALIKPGGEAPVANQGGRPPTNSQSGTEALDGHNLLTW